MASLVYGFGRGVLLLAFPEKLQGFKETKNLENYEPAKEILATIVKSVGVAGAYWAFSKIMAQESSFVTKGITGALGYIGLLHLFGTGSTDFAVAMWGAKSAYFGFKRSVTIWQKGGMLLGYSAVALISFFHTFTVIRSSPALEDKIDGALCVPQGNNREFSVWTLLSIPL